MCDKDDLSEGNFPVTTSEKGREAYGQISPQAPSGSKPDTTVDVTRSILGFEKQ